MRIADGVFWMAERDGGKLAVRLASPGFVQDLSSHASPPRGHAGLPGDLTFRDLARLILTVGRFFRGLGGRKGDIVALYLDNSTGFLALFLGLAHAGFVVAPLNTRLTRGETDVILADMSPWRTVVEQDGRFVVRQQFDAAADDVELDLHTLADSSSAGASVADASASDTSSADSSSADASAVDLDSVEFDAGLSDTDIFYLGYSSGTTGQPKGLLRTHKSWTESFFGMTLEFGMNTDSVLLVPGPLCYSASLIAALHALFIGGTVFIEHSFDPVVTATLLSEPGTPINAVFMVPAMYRSVLETLADKGVPHGQPQPTSKSLTCVTCGDKMPQDLYDRFTHRFPRSRVFEYYGSSEVGFVSVHDFDGTHEGTVGKPFFPARVRTVEGEIQVKSGLGFAGYCGAAEHQLQHVSRPDGWLTPGDHGHIVDGCLHVIGRSSDLIVRGAVNLYPAEIESVVRAFPGVSDTAVFGVPHDRLGEVPICAVVWRDGVDEAAAVHALSEHLRRALAGYKQPDDILSLSNLPRNAAGKVSRTELRERYLNGTSSRRRRPGQRA